MKQLRVLVACEESQAVTKAFRDLGHQAFSCDLLPPSGGHPEWHLQGNVLEVLDGWQPVMYTADCDPDGEGICQISGQDTSTCDCIGPTQDGIEYKESSLGLLGRPEDHPYWDLVLAFPPCTDLAVSGASHFAAKRADGRQQASIKFFLEFTKLTCPWVIENPVGIMSTIYRKPDQIIQPFQFGHPESKKTCLWLHKLPYLQPTEILPLPASGYWSNQTPSGQNKLGPSADRARLRSKTYHGIAQAMATQFSEALA